MLKIKNILLIMIGIVLIILLSTTQVKATTATVTTETLKLRSGASADGAVIGLLGINQELEFIETSGDWSKVKVNDKTGYVSSQYIKVNNDTNQEKTDSVENTIEQDTTNEDLSSNNTVSNNTSEENKEQVNTIIDTTENTSTESLKGQTITLNEKSEIRIIPIISATILGTIEKDTQITVIAETNGWSYIESDELIGWIRTEKLQNKLEETQKEETTEEETISEEKTEPDTAETTNTEYTKTTKYVNTSSAYIRSEANTSSKSVTNLILNTDVTVVGEEGEWYKVEYNEYKGYIRKDLLSDKKSTETSRGTDVERTQIVNTSGTATASSTVSKDTVSTKGEEIVKYAKQFLGTPYVYGASGPSKFDCSGFTTYVYKHFGYSLSRSAIAQSKNGTAVDRSNLKTGDIVCFLDYETMDKVGHVGIYIGNGDFIHASSGSGNCVKISTLLTGSYNKRYETARRII